MKVLVACEESQAVTIELRKLGHEAFSCDLIPCSGGHPEWHIQGDVLDLIDPPIKVCSLSLGSREEMFGTFQTMDGKRHELPPWWDMIIAFPPCTYISNAGARHLYPQKGQLNMERYKRGMEAKDFFLKLYNADCERVAIENPVPSTVFQMPKHTQEIQPYQFCGEDQEYWHPYTKKTRLWLKGLPPLIPTSPNVKPIGPWCPSGTSRKKREAYGACKRGKDAMKRAKTFPGIARAMAEQWTKEWTL